MGLALESLGARMKDGRTPRITLKIQEKFSEVQRSISLFLRSADLFRSPDFRSHPSELTQEMSWSHLKAQ